MSEKEADLQPMFICGAQTTTEGDMISHTFSVFSIDTEPEEATAEVLRKILVDIEKLEMTHVHGSIEFQKIFTWDEWAKLKIDRDTKMAALACAITDRFLLTLMMHSSNLVALPWVPREYIIKS